MTPRSLSTGIMVSVITDYDNPGAGVSTGLLQEDGTSFILLETADFILQES